MRPLSRWSIESKLPIGGGLLVLGVIIVLSTAAYREVRHGARAAAEERLTAVTTQLAQLLGQGTVQLVSGAVAIRSDTTVSRFLNTPNSADSAALVTRFTGAAAQAAATPSLELWSRDGRRVFATGWGSSRIDTARIATLLTGNIPDTVRIEPMAALGDSVAYPLIATLNRDGARIGYLVVWRMITTPPQARAQLNQLIGSDATLLLGNQDGSLWTDLGSRRPAPPLNGSEKTGMVEYRTAEGARLATVRPITGTPWNAAVEFSSEIVDRPARLFLARTAAIAAILSILAVIVVWIASRRISRPLRSLTSAVETVSTAETPTPVAVSSNDELGRLAEAFNVMAQRVQDARSGLEKKVDERTGKLHDALQQLTGSERRLSIAKETAERANKTKSAFLAKMSHELRTPLNSIIGFSEVLEEQTFGPLNDKQRRYVGNVLTSGRQLLDLINDILDLSKVEAGRMDLARTSLTVLGDLTDIRTSVAPQAERKRLRVDLDVAADLPQIHADPAKFKQIMLNLLSNAIKFTPDGGHITIAARRAVDSTDLVEVSVTDTGIGIRPEDQARVFDEFEQIDSEYGRRQQGTGLGLALTRKLIELHGGKIWVDSQLGTGSAFRFTMPVARTGVLIEPPVTDPAAAAVLSSTGRGALVLVVEDDEQAREILSHQLRMAGYRVVEAASGDVAVSLAAELKPAAITLDIMLPGKHGHEVLANLKARPETSEIPVVVVSMTEERELGLSLGASDWLVKPARREDFIAALRRVVGTGSGDTATVLVIDDEQAFLELVTGMLSRQGFKVVATNSGRDAVALVAEHRPAAVVLDLMMPDPNGFEVARNIRAMPEGDAVPIVVFSAKDLTADERAQLAEVAEAVLSKGHGRDALLRELARVVRPGTATAGAER